MHTRRRLWCTDLLREDATPTESLSSHESRNDILLLEPRLGVVVIAEGRGSEWSFSTHLPHHPLCLSGTKDPEMKGSQERDTCKSLISCFHSKADALCFILGPDQYWEKLHTDFLLWTLLIPKSDTWLRPQSGFAVSGIGRPSSVISMGWQGSKALSAVPRPFWAVVRLDWTKPKSSRGACVCSEQKSFGWKALPLGSEASFFFVTSFSSSSVLDPEFPPSPDLP